MDHPAAVALERDDAQEIAEGIGALGSWLYQAPEAIRRDFARHALHHSWRHLCTALDQ